MTLADRRLAFPVGARVRLSAKGRAWCSRAFQRHPAGVVVTHGRRFETLTILRDGLLSPNATHWSLWEREPAAETSAEAQP